MKAILEFNLDDYENNDPLKHAQCLKAQKLILCLTEIAQALRIRFKYDGSELTQDKFYEILHDNDINLSELS